MNHIHLLIRNQCGSHIIHGIPNPLTFQQNYARYDGPSESGSFFTLSKPGLTSFLQKSSCNPIMSFHFACFQVEEARQCQFLLVHSEADGIAGPYHRDRQVERFRRHGCTNYRVLSLPGAGHLLEPPYTPLSDLTYAKQFGKSRDKKW